MTTDRKLPLILAPVMLALLASCSGRDAAFENASALRPASIGEQDDLRRGPPPPASPADVRIGTYNPDAAPRGEEITVIRRDALQEAAQSYGSQLGYARRAWEIAGRLESHSGALGQTFDFNRVVSPAPARTGMVIPPVVTRSTDAFLVNADGTEASAADEYLTILRPGRIAPVVPTWRDYLLFSASAPEEPARSLLPSTGGEEDLFKAWFEQGWAAGVELADAEFSDRVARLQRDYTGMLQYRRLVAQGMMDRMVLADADFGVTGGDGEMRIGSRTVRVTSAADFQTDPTRWRVAQVSARDALVVAAGETPSLDGLLP